MENKGITLVDRSLRDFAYADRSMFEIVIQNLLANALKFSQEGDTITISNHISNGSCIISVADTGVGISKQNIEKLFKNNTFTTLGTNNEKGTGLGLSICKELIELNKGKIWVESTPNVGSTFYVQLPKSKSILINFLEYFSFLGVTLLTLRLRLCASVGSGFPLVVLARCAPRQKLSLQSLTL